MGEKSLERKKSSKAVSKLNKNNFKLD